MNRHVRPSLKIRLCASLIAVFVCAATGEVILRVFAPFPDYTSQTIRSFPDQYHPLFGYTGIPHLDTMFILPDVKHRIRNNSLGFRDKERSYDKGEKRCIIVLGDSTAWGWGVEQEDRFSDVMEERLDGWEVINLAQAGYSTDQELLVLETEGLKYHPDLVLLLFDRNDVVEGNNAHKIDGFQPKPFFIMEGDRLVLKNTPVSSNKDYWKKKALLAKSYGMPGKPHPFWSWSYLKQDVLTKSHLYNWLAFRLAHPIWERPESGKQEDDLEKMEKEMGLTKELLKKMNRTCRKNNARLIIADIPSAYSPLISKFCNEEKIPYIDLKTSLEGRLRPVQHRKVGHWNRYGHRLVADKMIEYLRKHGFLEP